jgi:anti-sigma B factor antagonist
MQVQFSDEGEQLIARPQGRMETAEASAFAAAVEQRLQAGTRRVTVDLEQVEHIGFSGLRALLRLGRSLKRRDTRIAIVHAAGPVREALEASGLDEIFPSEPASSASRGNRNEHSTP